MRDLDLVRLAQVRAVEAPLRAVRGGVALWLLARVALAGLPSATAPANLWLLFVLVGLRVASVVLRRAVRPGLALGTCAVLVGALGFVANAEPGREVGALLMYASGASLALWFHGRRAWAAATDLLRYDHPVADD